MYLRGRLRIWRLRAATAIALAALLLRSLPKTAASETAIPVSAIVSAAQPVPGTGIAFPAPLATAAVCIIAWHFEFVFVAVVKI